VIREITPGSVNKPSLEAWISGFGVYGFAVILSATILGGVVGAIGSAFTWFDAISRYDWSIFLIVIVFTFALNELGILRFLTPSTGWQVPASWSRFGKSMQALLYGLVLGPGIFTFIPFSTFYVLLLFEASLGVIGGICLALVYSVSRVLAILIPSVLISRDKEGSNISDYILANRPLFHRINGVVLMSIAQILVITTIIARQ
jgi:hypothetical protein